MLGVGPEPWHQRSQLCRPLVSLLLVASPSRRRCHVANALLRAIAACTRLAPSHVASSALSVALGFEALSAESSESSSLAVLISLLPSSALLPFWRCPRLRRRHCRWRRHRASSLPVHWATIVACTSLAAKAAASSSSRGAPSPYPNAHVLLARPPYEGSARQICALCGKGCCLVVVDGGACRVCAPCGANVGLDHASGHRARGPPGGDRCLVVVGSGFTMYARLAAIDAASSS